jgi:hypothetical protein
MRRLLVWFLLPLAAACGGDESPLGPTGSNGQTSILLSRAPGASGSIGTSMLARSGPPVDFTVVESLELVIDRVEAHRISGGGWISVDVDPVTIDLAGLGDGTVVELAAGALPDGTYNNLRLFLQSASVAFLTDVTVGNTTYQAMQQYDLEIPSADNNGLQIPTTHFVVDGASETVLVLFDPAATIASVGATGSGKVMMSPILREADESDEANVAGESSEGENDESDEGDDGDEEDEGDDSGDDSGSQGSGSASILVGAGGGVSSSILGGDLGVGVAGSVVPGGSIDPADVTSLRLGLCEIRAIRNGGSDDGGDESEAESEEEADEGEADGDAEADAAPACLGNAGGAAWTRIPLEDSEVDLFALGDGEVAEIAFGELPAGRYRNVRLYLSGAWITFATDMTIGNTTIPAGEEVELRISSADKSGLKIPASHFEVVADAEEALLLIFDRTSVSSLKKTGQAIQMSPILREATASEEAAAEGESSEETP